MDNFKQAILDTNIVSKTDIHGIITFANDEFCKLCGYSRAELIGKNHNIIRHPDTPKSDFAALWENILAGRVHKCLMKNKAKNGSTFYTQNTIIPLIKDGKIVEFIAIRHDVSEIFFLNEKLAKTQNELQNANKKLKILNENLQMQVDEKTKSLQILNDNLKTRVKKAEELATRQQFMIFLQNRRNLLANTIESIAHQWRQPLNELSLAIYLLKNGSKKHYEYCQKIIQNMSQIIESFKDFAHSKEEFALVNAKNLLKNALKITKKKLKKQKISLHIKCLNESEIFCERTQIEQVLINLITNSIQAFSDQLNPKICIIFYEYKNKMIFKIIDNAGGIDESKIDYIFDPYFTTKFSSSGTGLGLHICQQILLNHKAKISVKNEDFNAFFAHFFRKKTKKAKEFGACFSIEFAKKLS